MAASRNSVRIAKKTLKWLAWCYGVCLIIANTGSADITLQLDWDSVTWPSSSTTQSYTIGSGAVSITFNGPSDTPPGDTGALVLSTPLISSDLTGGLFPPQEALEIDVEYLDPSSLQQIPIIIDFTYIVGVSNAGVRNVSFSIFDLDRGSWEDKVKATATTDGTTFFNPTDIIDSANNSSDGINTVTGTGSAGSTSATGTATFIFDRPGITQIRLIYSNLNDAFQWISLHDINFTAPADVDLSIGKSHAGSFTVGQVGTYTLSVGNAASATTEFGPITVTDELPAGLSFVSASGTGWTCGAAGQEVTCTHPGPLVEGSALPDIRLDVLPGASAEPSVENEARVAGTATDSNLANNSSSDATTVDPAPAFTPRNKPLYLYTSPANDLSRTPPTAAQPNVIIRQNDPDPSVTWTLSPPTQMDLTIDGGVADIPVVLVLSKGRIGHPGRVSRTVQVALSTSSGSTGTVTRSLSDLTGISSPYTFLVPIGPDIPLPAGSTISLTVTNVTPGPPTQGRPFRVYPVGAGTNSRVELTSETVIDVDIQFFDVPYSGGSPVASFPLGSTAYIRAVVTDPFGSFDIDRATITIENTDSTIIVNNAAMPQVADDGVGTKTYEYAQVVAAPIGDWTATVTANEGTEEMVSDIVSKKFRAGRPDIVFNKSSQVIDDGLGHSAPNAFAIPGAIVLYTLSARNQGDGFTDDNVTIEDTIPANTRLCVADPCAQSMPPIQFIDAPPGTVSSGLIDPVVISYSITAGPPYTYGYSPVPDGSGYDSAVTSIQIQPTGEFNPASGGTPAGFNILFRVQVR